MWCTATPGRPSTAACSLHRNALIHDHDPDLSLRTPLPCKILGSPESDWTRLYWTVCQLFRPIGPCPPHGVSSRPVWPRLSTDLQARARCIRCLAEQIHLGLATFTKARPLSARACRLPGRGGEHPPQSRATCRQHERACPLLDLAYGWTPVRPAAEAPRASCSSAAVLWISRPCGTHSTHNTVLLTLIVQAPCI